MRPWRKRRVDDFIPAYRPEAPGGGPRYWPDTFSVDMSPVPEAWALSLAAAPSGHQLAASGLSVEGVSIDAALMSSSMLHERLHWFQSIGTSYGLLLSCLQILRGELATCIFTTATAKEREAFAARRAAGKAAAHRAPAGPPLHAGAYSATVQSLVDHWWASVAAERFLSAGRVALLGQMPANLPVGMAFRYIAAGDQIRDVFNSSDQGFFDLCLSAAPEGQPDQIAGETLTVANIEEGAAVAAQFLFLMRFKASLGSRLSTRDTRQIQAFMDTRWRSYASDPSRLYLRVVDLFEKAVPDYLRSGSRWLEELTLACDIALNPPWPCIERGSWPSFHPVSRFRRLLAAIAQTWSGTEPCFDAPLRGWWPARRAELLAASGLQEQRGPVFQAGLPLDNDVAITHPAANARCLLQTAHHDAMTLRERVPEFAPSPADGLFNAPEAIEALIGSGAICFECPLAMFGGQGFSYGLTTPVYVNLLSSLADLRLHHSLLALPGAPLFSGFPDDLTFATVRKGAIANFESAMGIRI